MGKTDGFFAGQSHRMVGTLPFRVALWQSGAEISIQVSAKSVFSGGPVLP
jgi:hypothetical protein